MILTKTTILVIEDDDSVRQTLIDMLELNGFRTLVATNGLSGLQLAQREAPSLIVTDVAMPGMTGFELLEQLRRDEGLRAIPVIVISAQRERAATRRGMELGAADFISKPFTEAELMHSITTRLEKKALVDELDAFAHTVAHDLKNPLCVLAGRISILQEMIGNADPAILQQQASAASLAATRLNRILDELLILAGVRHQAVIPTTIDTASIVAEAVDRLKDTIEEHNACIVQTERWPVALGYSPWVTQVWVNYLSNAAKYGGRRPNITLGGELSPDGHYARFFVQDNGPGMDESAQRKLFQPFTRLSNVRTGGHGLGLSIVRRIIEKLGGRIGVDSTPGQGARFWFDLPIPPESTASPPPWGGALHENPDHRRRTVHQANPAGPARA
ncbi:MAG: hybrid sensor histidine kinase/response regulator [Verrucomicrobiota bacterium]